MKKNKMGLNIDNGVYYQFKAACNLYNLSISDGVVYSLVLFLQENDLPLDPGKLEDTLQNMEDVFLHVEISPREKLYQKQSNVVQMDKWAENVIDIIAKYNRIPKKTVTEEYACHYISKKLINKFHRDKYSTWEEDKNNINEKINLIKNKELV
jgi:antitoxin component of RelBE/YafQ-DinJ toxin-antitoxin module